jgi:hypothetical protein
MIRQFHQKALKVQGYSPICGISKAKPDVIALVSKKADRAFAWLLYCGSEENDLLPLERSRSGED